MARIRALAEEKLAELDKTIKDRREGGLEAALPEVLSDRGKRYMDELRAAVGEMRPEKEAEYHASRRRPKAATAVRTAVFVLTASVNLVFLAWAYRRIAKEIRRRETAIAETGRQKDLLATTLASIGDGVIVTDTEGPHYLHEPRGGLLDRLVGEAGARGLPSPKFSGLSTRRRGPRSRTPSSHVLRTGPWPDWRTIRC